MDNKREPRRLQPVSLIMTVMLLLIFAPTTQAKHLSANHSLTMDPLSGQVVTDKVKKEILNFFHEAEVAIENEKLDDLMTLYSDKYVNGPHSKEMVRDIWKRLFSQMDRLATVHRMSIITTSPNSDVVIIRCSGLLVGHPQGEKSLTTADTWMNNEHVLAKVDGKWKLIGTTGNERERFWFDKSMHPLF